MFSFIKNNLFLSHNQKNLNAYEKLLAKVNNIEEETKKLSDDELSQKHSTLKIR